MKTKSIHKPRRRRPAMGLRQQRNRQKSTWRLFKNAIRNVKWTQAEAARQLYVTPNYISMICRGHSNPSESLTELLRLKVAQRGKFKDKRMAKIRDLLETIPLAQRSHAMAFIERFIKSYPKARNR